MEFKDGITDQDFYAPGIRLFLAAFIGASPIGCTTMTQDTRLDSPLYHSPFGENVLVFDPGMDQQAIQDKQLSNNLGGARCLDKIRTLTCS